MQGLDCLEVDTQRRDFVTPKFDGAIYNPTWGEHVKGMNLAMEQVDRVQSLTTAQKSVDTMLSMMVPKPFKALTDTAQTVKGLLAWK